MALQDSSLAIAADLLAQGLDTSLTDVHVVVDTPAATQKLAAATEGHYLNIFFYRVAHSGNHAAQTPGEPMFLRLFALLTPFPSPKAAPPEPFAAMRILGTAMRHFHENPVTQVMTTPLGAPGTQYRLEVVPQAPNMEELNHIWTTQGSEISYQLSAAYEFALVPIDPHALTDPPATITTPVVQVDAHMARRHERPVTHDMEHRAFPVMAPGELWSGPAYLPRMLAVAGGGPAETAILAPAAGQVDLAVAGLKGSRAEVRLTARDAAGAVTANASHIVDLATHWLDLPEARVTLAINLAGAATLEAQIRAADAAGAPLTPDRVGATLTFAIGGP